MLRIQEKILIHRAKRGDQSAFARLCEEYRDKIYHFVYFRVSDKEKVQDLTSEIFFKILDTLVRGKTEIEDFRAFLYQTARNLIIDFYRANSKKDISLDEVIEKEIGEETDLVGGLDIKIDLLKIEEALKKIPDRYREIIILRFVDELSFKEIAKIVDESESNVRQIVSRGLKLLRRELTTNN